MKVKLTVARAGADFSNVAGDIIEVDKREALELLNSHQAEPVVEKRSAKAEHRVTKPAEDR